MGAFFCAATGSERFFSFCSSDTNKICFFFPNKDIRDLAATDAKDLDELDEDGEENSLTAI